MAASKGDVRERHTAEVSPTALLGGGRGGSAAGWTGGVSSPAGGSLSARLSGKARAQEKRGQFGDRRVFSMCHEAACSGQVWRGRRAPAAPARTDGRPAPGGRAEGRAPASHLERTVGVVRHTIRQGPTALKIGDFFRTLKLKRGFYLCTYLSFFLLFICCISNLLSR